MNFPKLLLALSLLLGSGARAQTSFTVTNQGLGTGSSLDDAINAAMLHTSGTMTIYLDAPGYINLTHNLPLMSLIGTVTVSILPSSDPSYPGTPTHSDVEQGMYMTNYSVAPVGGWTGYWPGPAYGLSIAGCDPGTAVIVRNITFSNFNKVMEAYMNSPNGSDPYFTGGTGRNYHCGGGPPCLASAGAGYVEVSGCRFTNYVTGIQYNKTNKLVVSNNTFSTDRDYGCAPSASCSATGVYYLDDAYNSAVCQTTVSGNTMSSNGYHNGAGIVIDPYHLGPLNTPDQTSPDIPSNVKVSITGNSISGSAYGVIQGASLPNRTVPDNTYNITISTNTLTNTEINVSLESPFKHFHLTDNILKLKTIPSIHTNPHYLSFGSYSLVPNVSISGQYIHIPFPFTNNAYGFDIINASNSLSLTPVNTGNSFICEPTDPSCTWAPTIYSCGDFLDNTPGKLPGLNFIGLNFQGGFEIDGGKSTTIRDFTNTVVPRCQDPANIPAPPLYIPPIQLTSSLWTNGSHTTAATAGNNNLLMPSLQDARIVNGQLIIGVLLATPQFSISNGKYVLEFYKSNIKGELVTLINNQDVLTLNGIYNQYTIPPRAGIVINPGDRIGVSVTSVGDYSVTSGSPTHPLGTSPVSYIYTLPPCTDCVSDFAPIPGKSYLMSCWVSNGSQSAGTYASPSSIAVMFTTYSTTVPLGSLGSVTLSPAGPMIDGWQKIEGELFVPGNAVAIKLEIDRKNSTWYVDDFRFHPVDGNAKTYAYDPYNMRLMAELDEQNFATFYEYDEEGKLVRVKKETEKGIMTIKESRSSKPVR